MSITDASFDVTRPSSGRASYRSPEAVTALAGRIRSLQRSEPRAVGDERTAALAELALVQLQLERLSLGALKPDADHRQMLADVFALAERVDRIARLWPRDARPNLAGAAAHRPLPDDVARAAA